MSHRARFLLLVCVALRGLQIVLTTSHSPRPQPITSSSELGAPER